MHERGNIVTKYFLTKIHVIHTKMYRYAAAVENVD